MAHSAIAFAKASFRRRFMVCTTSIGPGALNMVTAAAVAHVNRLPVLLLPGDVFANRLPDPVLQQAEDFSDGTVLVNDCFRPVSRYFDRINRAEQLIPALQRAMHVLTDPAECGPVTLAMCQDVQAEAYDWPETLFAEKLWTPRRIASRRGRTAAAVAAIKAAKKPMIIAGGGALYSEASAELQAFAETHGIPVAVTQAGKSSIDETHPLALGAVGVTGTSAANALAGDADLVLAVGTRLQDFTTGSWALFKTGGLKIVALNATPYDTTKHNALPLVSDARVGLAQLSKALAGWRAEPGVAERASREKAIWLKAAARALAPTNAEKPSDAQVIGAVARALGGADVDRRQRVGRPAGRTAQAVVADDARQLPHGIRLLLHGLRDCRRRRRQDGASRQGGHRDGRRRLLHDDELGARHVGQPRPEADHRRARQPWLRLHQSPADGHRRRELQQSLRDCDMVAQPDIDFRQHAESMGAIAVKASSIGDLETALETAKERAAPPSSPSRRIR